MQNKYSETTLRARIEEDLRAVFPTQLQFDFCQAAKIIGCSVGHISNCESFKKPLFPSVRLGRKRLVQFHDIVDFLVNQRLRAQIKRGAPTKAERLMREGGRMRNPKPHHIKNMLGREAA